MLIPLLLGFVFDSASAFTTFFSRRWGARGGQWMTFVLRNILGIPLWVIGIGLAVHAPSPALFKASAPLKAIGWVLLAAGSVVQLLAIASLGGRAAKPSMADALVERGIYRHIRHPIYAGLLLEFAAIILVRPSRAVALACGLGMLWACLQSRFEELDLLQRMPAYREYLRRVPRFLPRLLAALLLASQLSCGGGVVVAPDRYPTAVTGCQLPGVRVGEKLRLTLIDGRKPVGRFARVDCAGEPTLLLVGSPVRGDPWSRPDTQAITFSSIKRIGVGDSESTKSAYAVVIGFFGVIAILLLAHAGGGSWSPT